MFLDTTERQMGMADKLTVFCEPNVYTTWYPQHRTTLQASTPNCVDSFTFIYVDNVRTTQETHASKACYVDIYLYF
jgi:hypothetical protein